ncbi:conserved exported hypothetical protein [Hyella patelloides LEGE 07179]|uniref:Uncharacterized protein n=1 Tax=Hyella patelloides LEGE 07179 TaxID=945734 RepID=A0A563VPH0_9CYAN|nr:COP23 domain-containing protein [Hyella patelloides]VEP13245.1 conserved exported hypothetical protein [Hyella patelloides LEGE 07179]
MRSKSLIQIFILSTLAFLISSVSGQSTPTPLITFTCENNQGIPVTTAKNTEGQTQTIFYWKSNTFYDYVTPQKLCHSVTEKLNNYADKSNNSALFVLQPTEQVGLPSVCITENGFRCDVVLFTLAPNEAPIDRAYQTLKSILNQEISQSIQDIERNNQQEFYFSISLFTNEL